MPAYKDEKTGKWFCKFYYTDWQGVKRQKWKRGFATKKEALAYEREFLEKQSANPDMTFQSLYELYMEDMGARLKASTMQTKKHICKTHILPYFGNKPINEIKAADVRRWQTHLMNSPKHSFRDAIADKPLSHLCFQVLYWTGMREGELLALTAADIDLEKKLIDINKTYQRLHGEDVVTTPKTKKSKRKVPIPDFLCQELESYIGSRYMMKPDDRLFPVTKSYLSHEMDRGCKISGVKRIRVHDIRHSHASLLINQGCDALVLADRLGHEKVSTTLNTYSHLFPHKQQELVSNLEQLAGAGEGNTPLEPPVENPLLESMGIVYDDTGETSLAADTTAEAVSYGPMPYKQTSEEAVSELSAHSNVIPMPQRKII